MFVPRYPLHVVFCLTGACNLRCLHCSSAAGRRLPDEFSTAAARAVLDELAALGVVDVAFSGGEPLLRPDLCDLVAHAAALGLRTGTSTNGRFLSAERAAALKAAGLGRLQVSLDGPPAVHDAIRGAGVYADAVAAIERSVAAGLTTHVCFTAMARNYRYLAAVTATAAELGAHGFNLSQFVPLGRGSLREDLTPAAARAVMQTWLEQRQRYPRMRFFTHLAGLALLDPGAARLPSFIGCQAGIYLACITAAGDVTPCVMFPLTLGNLRRQSFQAIWDSAAPIRLLKERRLDGACGACSFKSRCGGCRAAAYIYHGDFLADDPRCWLLHPVAGD